jgi:hypothetical protein
MIKFIMSVGRTLLSAAFAVDFGDKLAGDRTVVFVVAT